LAKEIKPKLILPNSSGGRTGGGAFKTVLFFLVAFVFGVFVGMRADDFNLGQTESIKEKDAQAVSKSERTGRDEKPYIEGNQVVEENSMKKGSPGIEKEMSLKKKQDYIAKGLATDSVVTVKSSDKNDTKEQVAPPSELSEESKSSKKNDNSSYKKQSEYTLQISAFKKLERAQKVVDELKQKGYDAYIVPTYNSKEENWNLIRIGKFKTKEEAGNFLSLLKEKEGIAAVVKEFDHNPFKEIKD